ncbi:MAG TPA: hypothetical protein VM100_11750 [Longimicrobiales bacterium]|nr:hypothetical protein [Longimicrobiales bacterium]
MRSVLFRVLAAILATLTIVLVPLTMFNSDFREAYPFSSFTLIAGVLLIVPTFLAYAFRGEAAGNRVMVTLMRLLALPQALGDKLIRRYVKVPQELERPDASKALPLHKEHPDT